MKYWLTILTMVIIAGGCGPHEPIPDLTGNWAWASTLTDAKPDSTNPSTPANTGKSRSVQFKAEHWVIINNGIVTDSGSYYTDWKKIRFGEYVKALHFQPAGNPNDSVEYFKKYGDTLLFSYGFLGEVGVSMDTYVLQRN